MSVRVGQSGFRLLLVGAGALICTAGLAIGLTIWWLHALAVKEASANAGMLATVLAEQAGLPYVELIGTIIAAAAPRIGTR